MFTSMLVNDLHNILNSRNMIMLIFSAYILHIVSHNIFFSKIYSIWGFQGPHKCTYYTDSIIHIEGEYPLLFKHLIFSYKRFIFSVHQCWRLVHQRPSMCYHVYVIILVKELSVVRVERFCQSLYSLHVLNRDVNMIQTNKHIQYH